MEVALIAVCVAPLAGFGGFLVGLRYSARHLHEVLAGCDQAQLRLLARRTAEARHRKATAA